MLGGLPLLGLPSVRFKARSSWIQAPRPHKVCMIPRCSTRVVVGQRSLLRRVEDESWNSAAMLTHGTSKLGPPLSLPTIRRTQPYYGLADGLGAEQTPQPLRSVRDAEAYADAFKISKSGRWSHNLIGDISRARVRSVSHALLPDRSLGRKSELDNPPKRQLCFAMGYPKSHLPPIS